MWECVGEGRSAGVWRIWAGRNRGQVVDYRISDNRGASRHGAVKSAIYLGWWAEAEFRTCAARLVDLSHGGALVHVAILPPEETGLWLCLAGAPPGDWMEVEVVARETVSEDFVKLRLRFPESCPYELFEGAVLGHNVGS